jgi:hypothetical protein
MYLVVGAGGGLEAVDDLLWPSAVQVVAVAATEDASCIRTLQE